MLLPKNVVAAVSALAKNRKDVFKILNAHLEDPKCDDTQIVQSAEDLLSQESFETVEELLRELIGSN